MNKTYMFNLRLRGKTLIPFLQKSKPFNFDRFRWVSMGFDGRSRWVSILYRNLTNRNNIESILNRYRNDFDVESTSKRGCYDKDSTLASTSYQYHYDIVTTLSFRYGFDVATISIRCRIHIVATS